jgi:hypothetical protein
LRSTAKTPAENIINDSPDITAIIKQRKNIKERRCCESLTSFKNCILAGIFLKGVSGLAILEFHFLP